MQYPWLMTYPLLPIWETCHTSFIQKEITWRACFYNICIMDQNQNNMTSYFIFKERKGKHDPLNLPKRLLQTQRNFRRISLSPLGKASFRSKATHIGLWDRESTRTREWTNNEDPWDPLFLMNQRKKKKDEAFKREKNSNLHTHLSSKPRKEQWTSIHCNVKNRNRMCKAKDKTGF